MYWIYLICWIVFMTKMGADLTWGRFDWGRFDLRAIWFRADLTWGRFDFGPIWFGADLTCYRVFLLINKWRTQSAWPKWFSELLPLLGVHRRPSVRLKLYFNERQSIYYGSLVDLKSSVELVFLCMLWHV